MSLSHDDLLQSALQLSESERLELATELLNSIGEHAPGFRTDDPAFIAELERREIDGAPGVPWTEVKQSMDEKLGK